MKKLLNAIFLFLSLSSCAQTADVKGHVKVRANKSDFEGVRIYLLQDGKQMTNSVTDKKGNYLMKNVAVGTYTILFKYHDFKEKFILNIIVASGMKNIDIVYPDPFEAAEKVCPYNHIDSIIPIVYGMPGAETMKMADKGLVHLGGCVVSECSPRWYCKTHGISF